MLECADELLLLLILCLPGVDCPGDSIGRPFIAYPFFGLVDRLPRETHQRLAEVARKRGYCPKHWVSISELPDRLVFVEMFGWTLKREPYPASFYNCVRAVWWRGSWIKGLNDRPPIKDQ